MIQFLLLLFFPRNTILPLRNQATARPAKKSVIIPPSYSSPTPIP